MQTDLKCSSKKSSPNRERHDQLTGTTCRNSLRRTPLPTGTELIAPFLILDIFTAIHGMQTRSSDENSVCPSVRVCPSNAWIATKRKKPVQIFIPYERPFSLVFWEKEWLVGRPLLPEILGKPAPVGAKSPILNK